ncbi:hypothetical protein SO574_17565 [Vibrio alfacsensis]|uniref:hypothetical protein n=1 Tax=Vibrio alfacsensis TaxID=1074311 RepID=UPI002ADDFA2D|nr:hypothetical protein [Vibrio alfacsensis]WQE78948.1 hypothetical protein SO574_17565 [Vibrio alfacsensis]
MICIHEKSQKLPHNSPYLVVFSLLSLSFFAYKLDKLFELGLTIISAFLVMMLLKFFPRDTLRFAPKSITINETSQAVTYHQQSTVYFRIPLKEITQVGIQKESYSGNCLMLFTSSDSYQVPNSDNFDQRELDKLINKLRLVIDTNLQSSVL